MQNFVKSLYSAQSDTTPTVRIHPRPTIARADVPRCAQDLIEEAEKRLELVSPRLARSPPPSQAQIWWDVHKVELLHPRSRHAQLQLQGTNHCGLGHSYPYETAVICAC